MPTKHTMEPNDGDTAELCIERLSRKLSEVEVVMATSEGKANQLKKERDVARKANERLRKEVTRLNNELLKVRMNAALNEMEIIEELDDKDGANGAGYIDGAFLTSQNRRRSLPVTARWRQTGRRGSLDQPADLRKLLDKRSNELLQQRQQYRIFENKFHCEAKRCSKLEQDTKRLKQLVQDLLGIHDGRYHRSSGVLSCSKNRAVFLLVFIAVTLFAAFVLQ
ncbi:uncharacterized protein LOC144648816 [Oculina patagonica]